VHVERPAPLITLGNAGGLQVTIENPHQSFGDIEDGQVGRKPRRDRLAPSVGVRLE
jgi:hypothetical protein